MGRKILDWPGDLQLRSLSGPRIDRTKDEAVVHHPGHVHTNFMLLNTYCDIKYGHCGTNLPRGRYSLVTKQAG